MNDQLKLTRRVNVIVAAIFIAVIFTVMIFTVITGYEGINESARRMTKLSKYLPDDWNMLDMLNARIRSVQSELASNMWLSEELSLMNTDLQYAMGKRMILTGNSKTIKLNTGQLYELMPRTDVTDTVTRIINLRDRMPEGSKFCFVYEHPTLYKDGMIPTGYEIFDQSAENADQAIALLREAGIDVLDSRVILNATDHTLDELLMNTDQHWSTLSAFIIAERLTEHFGLDASKLDMSKFTTQTFKDLYVGEMGLKISLKHLHPDDVTIYLPDYDTYLTRYTIERKGEETSAEGTFSEAIVRWDKLVYPEKGVNDVAGAAYGYTEQYNILENPNAEDVSILFFKDSFGSPVASFMALAARKIVSVDMRYTSKTIEEFVEMSEPDIVIVAFSQQLLRRGNFKF